MRRRLGGDGGWPDAAPLSRGAGQRHLGGQRQRPVLDIARAITKSPETLQAVFDEAARVRGESAALDAHVAALGRDLRTCPTSKPARATFATGSRPGFRPLR